MSDTSWYRSLYWRIAVGFILFLAGVLAIQAAIVFWLIARGDAVAGPPPRGFTSFVARDLGAALATDPGLDLERYIRSAYPEPTYPFFVLMEDGRLVPSPFAGAPPGLVAEAREHLSRGRAGFRPADGFGPGPWPFRRPPRGRPAAPGEIVLDGRLAGVVVAVPQTPLSRLGPTMAYVAVVLVAGATVVASLVIFGPVRRRLRRVEDAARRIGAGDLTARASEDGGDEVASLARVFNRMADDLARRAEEVRAADRTRRLLLADVSHELQTPLTAMRGYLETLSMPALAIDQDTRSRYVGIVGEETRRLERIVRDLLDLARLEGGGGTLDREDVPIEGLFGRVAARHEREAADKAIRLTTAIAPGAELLSGDPLRLEQALQNLAANALRHTPPGGRVELRAEVDRGDVILSVADTGPGIPIEHLPFVFDRFYKVDPARAEGATGSGLGLSIVKAIVERHGGSVSVANAPEGGAIFAIRLPSGGAED